MPLSLLRKAVVIGASLHALAAPSALAQSPWTSFKAAELNGFSFTHAHLPDGRYLFGTDGQVRLQSTLGSTQLDLLANPANHSFDPAFIAVRSASSALIGGGGGFSTNNGLFPFDPAQPALAIAASLTSAPHPNAYAAVWWAHPTSGREGWILSGTNAAGQNNLSFLSADGSVLGPLTFGLSSFSGAVTATTSGDVLVALADLDDSFLPTALDNQVLRFTADQIDSSVAALLTSAPLLLERDDASVVFQAAASGSLAVDAQNRVWVGGYQIPYLQVFDPASSVLRRVVPLPTAPANHTGPTTYAVKTFTQASSDRVSFLANDSFYDAGSDLVLGDAASAAFESRSIRFAQSNATLSEASATPVPLTVIVEPAPTTLMSVQVALSGTATAGQDYLFTPQTVIIAPGETSATLFNVTAIDTPSTDGDRSIIATLLQPENDTRFGLGAPGTETFTVALIDNDIPPPLKRVQSFPSLPQVGTAFSHALALDNPDVLVFKWRATGLPPGLTLDPATGLISGTPTIAGDYDRIVITATNAFGSSSAVYALYIAPLPLPVVGTFTGFLDRTIAATEGLGARLDLVTTASGTFTATVTVGKKRHVTRGQLSATSGSVTGSLTLAGTPIPFTLDPATGSLLGGPAVGALLTGFKNDPNPARATVCNFAALPSALVSDRPEGALHGTLTLPARGKARIAGRTPDATPFTGSTSLGVGGHLVLYHALYRVPGSLAGIVTVASSVSQNLSGTLTWSKPPQTTGALYRNGWSTPISLSVNGGRYRAVTAPTLPLDLAPSSDPNATLTLRDGGLEALPDHPRVLDVTVLSTSRILTSAPLRLSLNNRTGLLSGSLTLPDNRRATFSALLIPKNNPSLPFAAEGHGHFLLPTPTAGISRAGSLVLSP